MLKSTYYKVETAGGVLYVKTWDTGCLIIKREGNLYKVENHSIPYKRQEGDIITKIMAVSANIPLKLLITLNIDFIVLLFPICLALAGGGGELYGDITCCGFGLLKI